MTFVFVPLTIVLLGLIAAVAVGRIGGGLGRPVSSLPSRGLAPGEVAPDDLERVRFSPALRGYRMDEVDAVLDRLAAELAQRDEQIEQLSAMLDDQLGSALGSGSGQATFEARGSWADDGR